MDCNLKQRYVPPGLAAVYVAAVSVSLLVASSSLARAADRPAEKPNIIFILADDLGYGDLGCYGQKRIKTPNLDRLASEGIRFTDYYAGSTVCAPSRCVLMVGQHTGHCSVRGNAGTKNLIAQSLTPDDVTVAQLLKRAGYTTALIGKWGLGEVDHPGHPLRKGFDYFYGYLNQVHAHNYYPEFLWRNFDKVRLRNVVQLAPRAYAGFHGGWATKKVDYSHDLLVAEALQFIEKNSGGPFFLYLALTIPHANNEAPRNGMEVPDYGIYADKPWPEPEKGKAAMISRMDRDIGRLVAKLQQLGIAHNTLVLFSSDNGPHREGGVNPDFFDSNGPLRGVKRDLYEGGVRVPFIAWWPGRIKPGQVSRHVGYFADFLPTAAELAGVPVPDNIDGISIVPTLLGRESDQRQHKYLYWEFYERGFGQAVRMGKWKAIRTGGKGGTIELFDLENDIGETTNLAAKFPSIAKRLAAAMDEAHVPSPLWKPRRPRISKRR